MKPFSRTYYQVIIITFLTLGITSVLLFIYLHIIDNKYSAFIGDEIKNAQNLQKLTTESNRNFFRLFEIIMNDDSKEIEELVLKVKKTTEENSTLLDSLSMRTHLTISNDTNYKNLIDARKVYIDNTLTFFQTLSTGKSDSSQQYLRKSVRPSFRKYQKLLEMFVDQHRNQLIAYSTNISHNAKKTGLSILVLGFSPLLIVSIFLIISFIILTIVFASLKGFDLHH
ncbi:MAG: MCP four helix bundle domain-containing protein [Bacteroidetes bacterium]|nr:MCP four helix bundle domain-containing protein [Bacteroidota bacterium]